MSNIVELTPKKDDGQLQLGFRVDENEELIGMQVQTDDRLIILDDCEEEGLLIITDTQSAIEISRDEFVTLAIAYLSMNCDGVITEDD